MLNAYLGLVYLHIGQVQRNRGFFFSCFVIIVTVCAVSSLTRHLRGNLLVFFYVSLMTLGGHVGLDNS
jgi:inner membrane protein involved in colicin E2 resistance